MKHKIIFLFPIVLVMVAALTTSQAVHSMQLDNEPDTPQVALGNAFTYQGRLKDNNNPANGTYDFTFKLFDALSGGAQVGTTQTKDDVSVSEGIFTVSLDFGTVFTGNATWLEVAVRPGGSSGAYTTLTPRQPLTAAPYALYSLTTKYGGDGSATEAARSDHNHLGETWVGSGSPLVITGTFTTAPYTSTLVVSNTDGPAIRVPYANGAGLRVDDAFYGLRVGSAESGVKVDSANYGAHIVSASTGLWVESATYGVDIGTAANSGVYVNSATNGVEINSASNGVLINSSSWGAMYMTSGYVGAWINSGGWGGWADAVDWGWVVDYANYDGINVNGAGGYAGYFGGAIYVTGGCIGCLQVVFGINTSDQLLQAGQIVSIQGMRTSTLKNAQNIWHVLPAGASQAAIGVVGGRAEVQTIPSENPAKQNEILNRLVPRDGPSQPGEYLTIITDGPVQVQAGAEASAIQPGMRLVVGEGGTLRPLRTVTVDGVELAENAPTLGIALTIPDEKGLVWVMVNPR